MTPETLDELVRDLTAVGHEHMPKSEVRGRINRLLTQQKEEILRSFVKWIADQAMIVTNDNDEDEVMVRLEDIQGKVAKTLAEKDVSGKE